MASKLKQFCPKGHDTFVCGRDRRSNCSDCRDSRYISHPRIPSSFCLNGHNKEIVGRDRDGTCLECRQIILKGRVIRNRILLDKAKDKPCIDCGIKYDPWVMDFDHLRDKEFTISSFYANYSETKLLSEIAKCDVVCSNCHRIRTHNRKLTIQVN